VRLSTKTTERWAPDWENNLQLCLEDRVYVTIKYPDMEEKDSLRTIESKYVTLKDREKEEARETREMIMSIDYDVAYILEHFVIKIENLEDEVDGKIVNLTTGPMLRKSRNKKMDGLIDKIVAKIDSDDVTEDEEKNSGPPSTS